VSIGNVSITPVFAGITEAGVFQIDIVIPAAAGTGDVPIQAIAGGVLTPSGAVISLQRVVAAQACSSSIWFESARGLSPRSTDTRARPASASARRC
jgi:hypothetical protein